MLDRSARSVQVEESVKGVRREWALDSLFLGAMVVLSAVLYVGALGFYSDDWAHLRLLHDSSDQSLAGLAKALFAGDTVIQQRPLQVAQLTALYWLFGFQPLGYHLTNTLVLAATTVFFYLALRVWGQPRLLAVTWPLVYALLPHYSTDRFWAAAFQAPLSLMLFMASVLADGKAVHASPRRLLAWKAVSVVAIISSGLAYELTLPLVLFTTGLLAWRVWRRPGWTADVWGRWRAGLALVAPNLVALVVVVVFKLLVTVRLGGDLNYLTHTAFIMVQSARVNYGTYGLGLPWVLWWIVTHAWNWPVVIMSGVIGVVVFARVLRVARQDDDMLAWRSRWLALLAVSLIVFWLGYAIFLVSRDAQFSSVSLSNRYAIAAALGVALSVVSLIGWLTSFLQAERRHAGFSVAIALLCVSGTLIINTLGSFWINAYHEQRAIVRDMLADVPALPSNSTLILDGVCFQQGGAYSFTGSRDLASIVIMAYGDPTLWATASIHSARVERDGIALRMHRGMQVHPYSEQLFVYNPSMRRVIALVDEPTARAYYDSTGFVPERDCPPGFAWGLNDIW